MYAFTPPWDIGRPQRAFERLSHSGDLNGRVLDVGCGTGEHALMAAALGHDATGIDSSSRAIDKAKEKALERSLDVRFLVWDALDLPALGERFDTVLDCGLFHIFDDHDRIRFVQSLAAAIPTGGHYHMLCFSNRQSGDWGPRRVTREEIETAFSDGWRIDSIEGAVIAITFDPNGVSAWHAAITASSQE